MKTRNVQEIGQRSPLKSENLLEYHSILRYDKVHEYPIAGLSSHQKGYSTEK